MLCVPPILYCRGHGMTRPLPLPTPLCRYERLFLARAAGIMTQCWGRRQPKPQRGLITGGLGVGGMIPPTAGQHI